MEGRQAYLGDGGDEAGCSLHFCLRECFRGGASSAAAFRSSTLDFQVPATEPNSSAVQITPKSPATQGGPRPLTAFDYIID